MASEKLFPYSKTLTKLNKNQRPWVALLTIGALASIISCVLPSKEALISIVNLGVLIAFFCTLVALFIIQRRNGLFKQMIVTALAFASWTLLTYYSWNGIGATHFARLTASLPLILALIAGLVMYFVQTKKCKA